MKKHSARFHWRRATAHLRDHFIPHAGNNHHPHLLKHHVLAGYTVILILIKVIAVAAPIALPSSSLFSSAITPKNVIDLTNQERTNVNLPALKTNELLSRAAANKAADMLANQYFAHTSPAGVTPWEWFKKIGYHYMHAGENLAVHFHEAEDVQAGWMASPSHRANIVSNKYTEIGVGLATGTFEGVPTTFVVQLFGQPAAASEAAVEPTTTPALPPQVAVVPTQADVAGVSQPGKSEPKKIVKTPVVNESKAAVIPRPDTYNISAEVEHAEIVEVHLAGSRAELNRIGETDRWEGSIAYDKNALTKVGEPLTISASGEGGIMNKTIALVAPGAETQQVYVFNEGTDRVTKLFGFFKITNLNDSVRAFYVSFVVFLAAALLLMIVFAKLRLHHPAVVSHALAVIVFAVFLSFV